MEFYQLPGGGIVIKYKCPYSIISKCGTKDNDIISTLSSSDKGCLAIVKRQVDTICKHTGVSVREACSALAKFEHSRTPCLDALEYLENKKKPVVKLFDGELY